MMTVVLAGLPIVLVIALGFAHMRKRRSSITMPDYAELPTPDAGSGGDQRRS